MFILIGLRGFISRHSIPRPYSASIDLTHQSRWTAYWRLTGLTFYVNACGVWLVGFLPASVRESTHSGLTAAHFLSSLGSI